MYPHSDSHSLYHPRPRQPSSSTSSTLLASSTSASGSGSEAWMPPTRASTSTSRSIFSDNDTEVQKYMNDEGTEVGTVVDHDRPLIDFDDDQPTKTHLPPLASYGTTPTATPTPGEKLRLLLRQMEAEVRSTTPAPPPPLGQIHQNQQRRSSENSDMEPPLSRSNWREGRRIGALPKERKYTPPSSPEKRYQDLDADEGNEEEDQEILDDSPPTPPLRITNPYLYASRKVSDGRTFFLLKRL